MPQGPYTPRVTVQGQRYVDEAVYIQPKALARALARTVVLRKVPVGVAFQFVCGDILPVMIGFDRIVLRWKKPHEVRA